MKTHRANTYDLIVAAESEDKGRSMIETLIYALFLIARFHRFRRDQFKIVIGIAIRLGPLRLGEPFLAVIAKKVFYDPIFQ